MEVNYIMVKGYDGRRSYRCFCVVMSVLRLNELFISRIDSRIMVRVILYEIVWVMVCRVLIRV